MYSVSDRQSFRAKYSQESRGKSTSRSSSHIKVSSEELLTMWISLSYMLLSLINATSVLLDCTTREVADQSRCFSAGPFCNLMMRIKRDNIWFSKVSRKIVSKNAVRNRGARRKESDVAPAPARHSTRAAAHASWHAHNRVTWRVQMFVYGHIWNGLTHSLTQGLAHACLKTPNALCALNYIAFKGPPFLPPLLVPGIEMQRQSAQYWTQWRDDWRSVMMQCIIL